MTETVATALDPAVSRIALADGSELGYDRLLLATGAEPRRMELPGADLDGVHYLRTLADCDALRERLVEGGSVVVIGAGWIGAEFAASARDVGADVTMIDPMSVPLERVLGPEVGAVYRDLHREHGVQLVLGTGVEAFEGERSVQAVKTGDGRTIECDTVVVGIGVIPRVELAETAGLKIDNGILVDEGLATSAPGVYAAGDVANAWHPFYERHVRVEHWANALNQGPAAARAMLGQDVGLRPNPVLLLRPVRRRHGVLGLRDGVGSRSSSAATRPTREFVAFWMSDERVVAGMNLNVWDVNEHVQALIRSRQVVDTSALTDPDTALDVARRQEGHRCHLTRTPTSRRCATPASRSGSTRSRASCWRAAQFAELVRDYSVTGATSNPTIFAKAISGSDRYDEQLRAAVAAGVTDAKALFFEIALEDVRRAAELLRPTYEASGGHDGFISFECTPDLADDTDGTVAQARELWRRLDAPNVMIKVPATEAGMPAIEQLTADGVNVNVTLLFSVERYEQVIDAYLSGLERRVAAR